MRLQDDIDFTTLTWVKQELDDTLKQSQQALEAYVEDTSDKSQMRFCASYLHQVQGTLRMVELYGAAMVVEEMERLALGLLDGQVKQADDAYTVLMRGMVQLPDYLERLQGGHRDIPIVLLPLLNDLRACRGEKLLSETSLFSPDLGAPLPASASGAKSVVPQPMIAANGGRLRLAFQFGLLKWFKGDDVDGNLTRLIAILERFRTMCTQADARRLLWVGAGALEAVLVKSIEASVALKLLIGRVDRELKRLIDAGETTFAAAPPNDLTKGLLYYVAQSTASSQRVVELRQVYKLDKLMPSEAELEHARGALSGHNRALLDTVGTAIKEDLLRVKDALDLYLRTGSGNVDDLAPQGDALHRVADTLGMLGLGVPRRVVLDQQDVLERIVRGRQPAEESVLLDIAGSLLYVESSLDDHIERLGGEQKAASTPSSGFELPQAEVRKILDATTKEASANIQQAKQDIVAFIESPWDHSKIEQIPRLLDEISGAMRMLNLPEPAALLGGVVRFAEVELLQHRRVPSGDQLDLMADAIASLEFYLEAVKEGRRNRDKILDVTRRSLEALGYWPLPEEGAEQAAEAVVEETAADAASTEQQPSEFPSFSETFTTEKTQPPESENVALQADGGEQLPEVELPHSDGIAVDALIDTLALSEPAEADGAAVESDQIATPEMSSAVEIAPGANLDALVVGETAADAVTPSVQDLDELRITSVEFEPPESVSAVEPAATEVAPTREEDAEVLETLDVESESAPVPSSSDIHVDLTAIEAAPIEPDVASPDSPQTVAALEPAVAEAAPAMEAALPEGMPTGFTMPDVGFHSVTSDEIDDEIREVFVEEVQDELDNLNKQYPAWKNDLGDFEKLKPVRRSFHTLKGSGRLVGAMAIGEYAWKIENMLNRVLDKTIQPTPAVLDLLDHAIAALPGMLSALKGEGQPDANLGAIMWVSDQLSSGQEVWLPKSSPAPAATAEAQPASEAGMVADLTPHDVGVGSDEGEQIVEPEAQPEAPEPESLELVNLPDAEVAEVDSAVAQPADVEESLEEPSPLDVDPMLMEILSSEVEGHLTTIRGYLDQAEQIGPQPVSEELLRAVHTLNGALAMVDLPVLTRVVAPLEGYLKRLRARGLQPSDEGMTALTEATDCIARVMAAVAGGADLPETVALAERVAALRDGLPPPDHPYHGFGIHVVDEARDDAGTVETDLEIEESKAESAQRPWYEADPDSLEEGESEVVATVEMTEIFDASDDQVSPDTLDTLAELAAEEFELGEAPPVEDLGESSEEEPESAFEHSADESLAEVNLIEIDSQEDEITAANEADLPSSEGDEALDWLTHAETAVEFEGESVSEVETQVEEGIEIPTTEAGSDTDETQEIGESANLDAWLSSSFGEETPADAPAEAAGIGESLAEISGVSDLLVEAGEENPAGDSGISDSLGIVDLEVSGIESVMDAAADDSSEADEIDESAELQSLAAEETEDFFAELDDAAASLEEREAEAPVESTDSDAAEQSGLGVDDSETALDLEEPLRGLWSETAEDGGDDELDVIPESAEITAEFSDSAESDETLDGLLQAEAPLFEEPEGGLAEESTQSDPDELILESSAGAEPLSDESDTSADSAAADQTQTDTDDESELVLEAQVSTPPVQIEAASAHASPAFAGDVDPDGPLDLPDMDMDLLDIFVEEAVDILDHSDGAMTQLRENPEDREPVASLQRDLHTLKGGARMAGLYPVGDLSHAMESLFESIVHGERAASKTSIEALEKAFDRLHGMVQRVKSRQAIAMPEHTIARLEAILEGREEEFDAEIAEHHEQTIEAAQSPSPDVIESAPESGAEAAAEAPARNVIPARARSRSGAQRRTQLDEDEAAARAAQQELIRVRADLLDNLVNFAGEVSIYRSRLEAQMGGFRFNLVEFEQTVSRLRDQLRKLEMETEAQILSRFQRESEESGNTEFDPLELDRFSTLQQLSRALAESVSDLVSIQNLLDDIARQSETLLLQQSRVSSDLQEGLMRTRMVPFESLVPRLRRILRQTASELGKKAQLKVEGTQGEMDRTVLERMTAPFEHMLRNSLAHGIEGPELRAAKGKSEEGSISIKVSREATEVVIQVIDDGGGMNRDAIRTKAIERGLMTPEANLSDRDIFQFVLEAGFSTASEVSKVAGRGVGMDVVASEVKQLGGSLELDSDVGIGTRITIRLPFTLAVAQAVMVKLGEATYAIPMTSITGVTRMPRKELERRLEEKQLDISYGGEIYQIYDLGDLLRSPVSHGIDEIQVPLLMSRTGDQRAAVRVTQVIGSKEVVVKSAGAQLSIVPGIFGATIMGDGRVVVILDLAPLVRHGVALRQAPELAAELELMEPVPEPAPRRQPLVMVVDDSITMRKVTTRVLERSNIDVFTAKDGLDAVEQLQDRIPDVILLDIEMPRMDGYEVATYIRNDNRLKHIPIIMITSRTGEKHRQRALEVGVDRYLGKPYQETDLLKNVQDALTAGHANVH